VFRITALRSFGSLEDDKGCVARGNGNKVMSVLECAAAPRFLRYGRNDKVGRGSYLELVGMWTGWLSQIPRYALNDDGVCR
jgi:hypothetical protein